MNLPAVTLSDPAAIDASIASPPADSIGSFPTVDLPRRLRDPASRATDRGADVPGWLDVTAVCGSRRGCLGACHPANL
ncbi:MAG: hypothetical protein IT424_10560 [Pirellulales bacterium]|nr:hypothetical protein [Pirellulales bacterium]